MSLQVSDKLRDILEHLREQCAEQGAGKSRWMRPPGWNGDPTDLENIAEALSREDVGRKYSESLTAATAKSETTMASCMARMTEMAYLGVLERSLRMRHLTPARAMAHATAMRKAHGHQAGVHTGGVQQHVQNLLKLASEE